MTLTSTDQPLYLLPNLTLADLGTPESHLAIQARGHAFHEAGHTWAAYTAGLPLRPATIAHDSDPYTGETAFARTWLAALGPLTQGVAVEADGYLYDGDLYDGHVFHDPYPSLGDVNAENIWQHTEEVRQETCCCRRGGDKAADEMLDDRHWVGLQALPLLRDWDCIDALAQRLMAGAVVEPDEIESLLGD